MEVGVHSIRSPHSSGSFFGSSRSTHTTVHATCRHAWNVESLLCSSAPSGHLSESPTVSCCAVSSRRIARKSVKRRVGCLQRDRTHSDGCRLEGTQERMHCSRGLWRRQVVHKVRFESGR